MNKKLNASKKKKAQKNSVINDIIKFKKYDAEKEKNMLDANKIEVKDNISNK